MEEEAMRRKGSKSKQSLVPPNNSAEQQSLVPRTEEVGRAEVERTNSASNRYKIGKKIGVGGFGEVFSAIQTEPIRREVAIKVVRDKLKPEDSREILSRFKQEKHALALMNHDSIAKIFDAGTTKTGQPYFVMELVKGVPVTDFVEQHELNLSARLKLFLKICSAVQHAHHKGVIHRDIKPDNILVAGNAAEPIVKVIDFGLAKVVDPVGTGLDLSLLTQTGATMGTYYYMSPEQAEVGEADIDTRTDVYSLGIVLFELLTGTTPLQHYASATGKVVDPIFWIKSQDAVRPSECLASASTTNKIKRPAKNTASRISARQISGDLDLVVQGAIEKARELRYESVAEFAADIRSYLAGEPIRRRPPSYGYVVKKFVGRHRRLVAVTATIFALLLIGFVSTFVLWRSAEHHRQNANQLVVEVQAQNKQLEDADTNQQRLIAQGSQISVERGRDAWHNMQTTQAIAHFAQALLMFPQNEQAQVWLQQALQSHRENGWNPPYWIVGGDSDTKKVVLSQDGLVAAVQSRKNNLVTLVEIPTRRILADSIALEGTIDDLYESVQREFYFLVVNEEQQQATVWMWQAEKLRRMPMVLDYSEEGEFEFSVSGQFLVRKLDQPWNKTIYGINDGRPTTFDPNGSTSFLLSRDDLYMIVRPAEATGKFLARSTGAFANEFLLNVPELKAVVPEPMETEPPAPEPAVPTPDVSEPTTTLYHAPSTQLAGSTRSLANSAAEVTDQSVLFVSVDLGSSSTHEVRQDDASSSFVPTPVLANASGSLTDSLVLGIARHDQGPFQPVITGGKIDFRDPGELVTAYPSVSSTDGKTELLLSFLDIRKQKAELVRLPMDISVEAYQQTATDNRKFQFFPGERGKFLVIQDTATGCGSFVDLRLFEQGRLLGHTKSPTIPIHHVVIDPGPSRALLVSRPVPYPQLQLYDFNSPISEPTLLSVPKTDFITNDLETYFVGNEIVCRFAKNAVAVWHLPTATDPQPTNMKSVPLLVEREPIKVAGVWLGDQPAGTPIYNSGSAQPGVVVWGSIDEVVSLYSPPRLTPEQIDIQGFVRVFKPTAKLDSLVTPIQRTAQGDFVCIYHPAPQSTIEVVNVQSANPIGGLKISSEFETLTDIQVSPSGEFLVAMGTKSNRSGVEAPNAPQAPSVLESATDVDGQELPSPPVLPTAAPDDTESSSATEAAFEVYRLPTGELVQPITRGAFQSFHPTHDIYLSLNDRLQVFDLKRMHSESFGGRAASAQQVAIACFSDDGQRIIAINHRHQLLQFSSSEFSEVEAAKSLSIPVSVKDFKALTFQAATNTVRLLTGGLQSYHANSPGCTNCGGEVLAVAGLDRLFCFNLTSDEVTWYQNVVQHSYDWTITNEQQALVAYNARNLPRFGPIPFDSTLDKLALDSKQNVLITARRAGANALDRVDAWHLEKNVPLVPTVRTETSSSTSPAFKTAAVLEGSIRAFFQSVNGFEYLDQPLAEAVTFDANDQETILGIGRLAGFELIPASLSDEQSANLRSLNLAEQVVDLPQLHFADTKRGGDAVQRPRPPVGVSIPLQSASTNREFTDQEYDDELAWVEKYLRFHRQGVDFGMAFDEGNFLRLANSTGWSLAFSQMLHWFELEEMSFDETGFVLLDRTRDLEFHVPFEDGEIKIRPANTTEWRPWRQGTKVPYVE
jgi:serine/threonine protein kinase